MRIETALPMLMERMDRQSNMHDVHAGDEGRENRDAPWLEATVETVVETMIVRAVRDAQQHEDPALRQEARTWLWVCCPDLADQLDLAGSETADPGESLPDEAAAYSRRQRAA